MKLSNFKCNSLAFLVHSCNWKLASRRSFWFLYVFCIQNFADLTVATKIELHRLPKLDFAVFAHVLSDFVFILSELFQSFIRKEVIPVRFVKGVNVRNYILYTRLFFANLSRLLVLLNFVNSCYYQLVLFIYLDCLLVQSLYFLGVSIYVVFAFVYYNLCRVFRSLSKKWSSLLIWRDVWRF